MAISCKKWYNAVRLKKGDKSGTLTPNIAKIKITGIEEINND